VSEFFRDLLSYGAAVLTSWKLLVGTVVGWLFFSVVPRLKPFKPRTILVWLGLFLVIAPFPKWREQRREITRQTQEITKLERDRREAEARRDSISALLTAPRTDEYREVRLRLAFFVRQADTLGERFRRGPAMPYGELHSWTERVHRYLGTRGLDPSYQVEFDVAAGSDDENTFYGSEPVALTKRRAVLVKFLQQLRRT
jgi:hypothetical protein